MSRSRSLSGRRSSNSDSAGNGRGSARVRCQYVCLPRPFFVLEPFVDALAVVLENNDALQALNALVVINPAILANGIDAAFVFAVLTGVAAELDPIQPAEQPEPAKHRKAGAQRAQVAAIELVNEHAEHQQANGIQYEWPVPNKE